MNTDIEVLKQFFAAVNRNDMHAAGENFAADIVRIEPDGFPTAGTYRGIEAVREHLRQGRATWAEGSCEPEGYFSNGDQVVVYLYAWVRMKDAAEWIGGRFADGFLLKNGKIVEYRSFGERREALAWAGIIADADADAAPGAEAS